MYIAIWLSKYMQTGPAGGRLRSGRTPGPFEGAPQDRGDPEKIQNLKLKLLS